MNDERLLYTTTGRVLHDLTHEATQLGFRVVPTASVGLLLLRINVHIGTYATPDIIIC